MPLNNTDQASENSPDTLKTGLSPEQEQQLEQELQTIWKQAANTRKASSARRIESILRNSRSELALRDLFMFAAHVTRAFLNLFATVLYALFNTRDTGRARPTHTDRDPPL